MTHNVSSPPPPPKLRNGYFVCEIQAKSYFDVEKVVKTCSFHGNFLFLLNMLENDDSNLKKKFGVCISL